MGLKLRKPVRKMVCGRDFTVEPLRLGKASLGRVKKRGRTVKGKAFGKNKKA